LPVDAVFFVFISTTPAMGHNNLSSLLYESALHVDEEIKMFFVFSASASSSTPLI
jgi:hypothetical protein